MLCLSPEVFNSKIREYGIFINPRKTCQYVDPTHACRCLSLDGSVHAICYKLYIRMRVLLERQGQVARAWAFGVFKDELIQ